MLKERLVVRNFGPITKLDIEIRPFTLFIGTQGEQGTGTEVNPNCWTVKQSLRIREPACTGQVTYH